MELKKEDHIKLIREFEVYLSSIKLYSENTKNSYIKDINKFREYLIENFGIDFLKAEGNHLQNYVQELRLKNFKSSSINRKISALRKFYRFLYKKKVIKNDPSIILKTLKKEKRLPSFFPEKDISELLELIKKKYESTNDFFDLRDMLIFELLVGSGLRVSELINLTYSSVNTIGKVIRVYGKGGKFRIVPLSETFLKYFFIYKKEYEKTLENFENNNKGKSYELIKRIKDNNFIFINKNFRKITRGGIFYILRKKYFEIGLNKGDIFPHKLRHTFATILLQNGADIRFIQKLLGHSSLASTEVYTHLDLERKKRMYKDFHPHG